MIGFRCLPFGAELHRDGAGRGLKFWVPDYDLDWSQAGLNILYVVVGIGYGRGNSPLENLLPKPVQLQVC